MLVGIADAIGRIARHTGRAGPLDLARDRGRVARVASSSSAAVLFAGGSSLFADTSVPVEVGRIRDALAFIDRETGAGATELLPALQRAMQLPMHRSSRS